MTGAEAAAPVLVVGREGQIARALAALSTPLRRFVCLGRADGVDLARPETLAAPIERFGPDIIVNAGAYTAVDRAESEAAAAFAVNRDGAGALAALAAARGLPLIHLSTDYVFDGRKPAPYVEDDPVAPLGVYGRSKAEGEAAIRAAGGRHLILRTAWVYAATGGNFVRTMLRLAATRDAVAVVDDQHGAPTAAADIADAIAALVVAIRTGNANWGTFHLTAAGETNWHGFAAAIFAAAARAGRKVPRLTAIPTVAYPTAARRPANSRLDCGKIAAAYGIALPDWREGLAAVMAETLATEDGGAA